MQLPPPTILTDEEFVENLIVVASGAIKGFAADPDTLEALRSDDLGLIIHARGVEIIEGPDYPARILGKRLIEETEEALRKETE